MIYLGVVIVIEKYASVVRERPDPAKVVLVVLAAILTVGQSHQVVEAILAPVHGVEMEQINENENR